MGPAPPAVSRRTRQPGSSPGTRPAAARGSSLHPGRGAWRVVRGLVVTVVALLPGIAGHALAGGRLPAAGSAPLLVALAAGLAGLCIWSSDRRWSALSLTGALAVGQAALHLLLMGGPMGAQAMLPAPGAMAMGPSPAPLPAAASTGHGGLGMLAAHLLATVVSVVLLHRGDAWCWRAAQSLGLAAGALVTTLPARLPAAPRLPVSASGAAVAPSGDLGRASRRRGPPPGRPRVALPG